MSPHSSRRPADPAPRPARGLRPGRRCRDRGGDCRPRDAEATRRRHRSRHGADDLRRRFAEGRDGQGEHDLRGGESRDALTLSTNSSTALETQIEQGAPADVFLSADTTNPQQLVDAGSRPAAGRPSPEQADIIVPTGNPAASRPRSTSPGPASRSSPPVMRCRSRNTPRSWSQNLAKAARLPGRLRGGIRRERRLQGGQRQGRGRQDRARRGRCRRSSTSPTPRRHQGRTDRRPRSANVPATYAGVVVGVHTRTPPRPSSTGSPAPTARRSSATFGFLAGIHDRRDPAGSRRAATRGGGPGPARLAWIVGLVAVAGLFALFLALPVVTLVARAVVDGSLAERTTRRSSRRLPSASRRPPSASSSRSRSGCRSPRPRAPRRSAASGSSRRSSTCRSSCRRRWPASRCCSCSAGEVSSAAARRWSGSTSRSRPSPSMLAQTFVSAPFFVRSARAGIAGVDRDVEDAARVDGATEPQVFRRDHRAARGRPPWRRGSS